ncbi:hypothetical protein ACTL6U_05270 [Rhodovibrionaceae bacterium A322]
MPDAFKNFFNPEMIALMGRHFKRAWPGFDEPGFVALATRDMEKLELKERSDQIKDAMRQCLPQSFAEAAPVLMRSLHPVDDVDLSNLTMDEDGIRGWATMPMTDYVGSYGLEDFSLGLEVQREITKRGSSEFGVRPFIDQDQDKALGIMADWAEDGNYHVRRLLSEGTRPRLPWAMRLPKLVADPTPLFPLLEKLKDDPKEYVRRSVANNLNDIAKDHPDRVADVAGRWLKGASPERGKLVRHACRSLVKAGHQPTLDALGFKKPEIEIRALNVTTPSVTFGSELQFDLSLASRAQREQNLVIDFVIHHRKANGKTSPKVFKWKTLTLPAGADHQVEKKHAIKPITTRVYYPGLHHLEIKINGQSFGQKDFELVMPDS